MEGTIVRVIIAGSRSITSYATVCEAIKASGFDIAEVVSGGAIGVDSIGEAWARGKQIHVQPFLPDYKQYGRFMAPKLRNQKMAEYANALIAVWDGLSPGTRDMIRRAEKMGLKIYIHSVKS